MAAPSSMNGWTARSAVALSMVLAAGTAHAARPFTIAIVSDGPSPVRMDYRADFREEIAAVLRSDFDLRFPEDLQVEGAWTKASIDAVLDKVLSDRRTDVVVTLGVLSTHVAGLRDGLPKPVVGAFVIDPKAQGVPLDPKRGTSDRRRFTYVTNPDAFDTDFTTMERLFEPEKMAALITDSLLDEIPALRVAFDEVAKERGYEIVLVGVGTDAQAALDAIPEDVDTVYVGASLRMGREENFALIAGLNARRLKTYSLVGRPDVERGILAGVASGLGIDRRARRVALNIQRIVLGESPSSISVFISRTERLVINMDTARAIQFYPSWAAMTEAELLNRERDTSKRRLTMQIVVEEALQRNLDVLAGEQNVEASARDIVSRRAALLPQAAVGLTGSIIDEDRTADEINRAQYQLDFAATAEMQVYRDPVYANLKIQKYIQDSVEYDQASLRLDTIQAASVAYLNVLRALTLERIRVQNLRLTRSNRELAVIRRSVGSAGPSEVYRWDSQLAQDQNSAIDALATRNQSEIALNRLLDRPLEEPFFAAESEVEDPKDLLGSSIWSSAIDNQWSFRVFRSFMSQVGLEASPELRAVDAGLKGIQRRQVAASRAWWLPQFFVTGQLGYVVAQAGNGSGEPEAIAIPGQDPISFGFPTDLTWLLTLNAEYPLFTGLDRVAEAQQAKLDYESQFLERRSLALVIEEQIRSSLHQAGASYAAIDLSQASADAALKNLEVIREAYAQGATGYLNLLDAQNQALNAELVAANAVYTFLVDLVGVQRAAARFVEFEDPAQQEEFRDRMQQFFQEEGIQLELERPEAP